MSDQPASPKKAFSYMDREERTKAFDEVKEKYKLNKRGELFMPKTAKIFAAHIPKNAKVLDLGSANGRIFSVLESIGITDTNGSDIDDYLTVARPKGSFKKFDFSTERFPYDDETFDAATSIEVVEHLENPYHFLREAARILKSGGVLIISTPNPNHIYNKLSFFFRNKFYRFLDGNDHIMLFAHYVLSKGALKYFDLVATEYLFGEMPYRIFSKFTYPENRAFGRTVFYILRKQ